MRPITVKITRDYSNCPARGYRPAIVIDPACAAALRDAISAAEGRASARTITPDEIANALYEVEHNLDLPKKALDGVKIRVDYHAQDFPRAYKYTPESTHFLAEYKRGSWRVTGIHRATTRRRSQAYQIELTDDAKEALLARFSAMNGIGF